MGENKFQQFRKPADQKSAGESLPKDEIFFRVKATGPGWYDRSRMEAGMEFVIPAKLFSSNWMEKIQELKEVKEEPV